MANRTVHNLSSDIAVYIDNRVSQHAASAFQVQASAAGIWESLFDNSQDMNIGWVLVCSSLVFLMQCGFTVLEAGYVHPKNVTNILFMHMIETCIAAACFWLVGWGLSSGKSNNGFLGTEFFTAEDVHNNAESSRSDGWDLWFMQWALAGSAGTIVAGSVAERAKPEAFAIFQLVMSCLLYPVVAHWVWGSGWLSSWGSNGFIDFAGSGVVNAVGGFAGLMGSIVTGARQGRFRPDGSTASLHSGNKVLQSLGVFILWFGWYGFTCGSTLQLSGGKAMVAGKAAVSTTLAAASACLTATLIAKSVEGVFDVSLGLCGVLAGLVSISANCAIVDPWMAVVIGAVGGGCFYGSHCLLRRCRVDDPCEGIAVHGFCGLWGMWGTGLFCTDDNLRYAQLRGADDACSQGLQLGVQVAGSLAIVGWTCVVAGGAFLAIAHTVGLRVSPEEEEEGLDSTYHGLAPYPKTGATARNVSRDGSAKPVGESASGGAMDPCKSKRAVTRGNAAPENKEKGPHHGRLLDLPPPPPAALMTHPDQSKDIELMESVSNSDEEEEEGKEEEEEGGEEEGEEDDEEEEEEVGVGQARAGRSRAGRGVMRVEEEARKSPREADGEGKSRSRSRSRPLSKSADRSDDARSRASAESEDVGGYYRGRKSEEESVSSSTETIGKVGGLKGIPFSYKVRRRPLSDENSDTPKQI